MVEAQALITQAEQLQLRLLAHADRVDVGGAVGATSPANWLAHQTRTTRAAAHRAKAPLRPSLGLLLLEAPCFFLLGGLGVEDLQEPSSEDAEGLGVVVGGLTEQERLGVRDHGGLDGVGKVVDCIDDHLRLASFIMSDDGHGKVHGRLSLPSAHGSMLREARFHTKSQRIALGLRDGGSTAVGCERPPNKVTFHRRC